MEHRHAFGKLFKGWRTCHYFGRNLGTLNFNFKSAAKSDDYLVDLEKRLQALSAPIRPASDAATSSFAQAGRAEKGMPALLIFSDAASIVKMGWLPRM